MTSVSAISVGSVSETRAYSHSPTIILLFCCAGLVPSLCLMTFGIDLTAGFV